MRGAVLLAFPEPWPQVDTAADMIADLMQPEDEARNEHKRMQLRELAALNGTLKARRCPLCWTPPMLSCDV